MSGTDVIQFVGLELAKCIFLNGCMFMANANLAFFSQLLIFLKLNIVSIFNQNGVCKAFIGSYCIILENNIFS